MSLKTTIKEKFGYDVSELEAYVDESRLDFVTRAVTEGRTLELIDVRDGIKGTQDIPLLDDTVNYQDASDCGFNASGDTEFDTTPLTVVPMKINKKFCNRKLAGFFTQQGLRRGTMAEKEELPFGNTITNHVLDLHKEAFDSVLWRSDSSLSTGNLSFFDGFKTQFDASSAVINATGQVSTMGTSPAVISNITVANAYDLFIGIHNIMVEENETVAFSGDFVLFTSMANLQKLKTSMVQKNLFHYSSEELQQGNFQVRLAGTDTLVIGAPGLKGTNDVYGGRRSRMIYGTDEVGDLLNFDLFYSKDFDELRFRLEFRAGVTVTYFNEFIKWNGAVASPSSPE